jgi:hypothetical protein
MMWRLLVTQGVSQVHKGSIATVTHASLPGLPCLAALMFTSRAIRLLV